MSRLRRDCRGGDSPPAGEQCAPLHGAQNGLLTSQAYGNGDSVSFTYDNLGRVKTTTYSDGRILTYRYTGDGQLYSVHDSKTQLTYQYSYDSQGRLMASSVKNADGNVLTTRQTYDANNQMTAQYWQLGDSSYSEVYTYNLTTGLLATHTPAVGSKRTYTYDVLQRLSKVTGGVYGKTYTYRDVSDTHTTTQVAGLTYDLPTDITYGYTYDVLGNIATYTQGDTTYSYTYDAQNQLLSQTDGTNTWTYTYDAAGNILTSSDGTTSHSYTYGNSTWKDLLTAVDGHAITYEQGENSNVSGNPISYYNGTSWTFDWEEGRRLVSANNGTTNLTYTYDSEGLRLSKTVDGVVHNYYYAGGKLLRETWGSNTLDFFYDAMGTPYALKYNGTLYYYVTNLQGDILHIVDASGVPVVSYTYSPYGKVLSTTGTLASTLGVDNPLRYRGYYYDTETGLYYLQSRYYDPELCRFINADSYASTGQGILGYNMFVYCGNNPVNMYDPDGACSRFLGFLWKVDCGSSTCETSKNYAHKEPSFFEQFLTDMARPREEGNTFSAGVAAGSTSGGMTAGKSYVISADTSYNYALQETTTIGSAPGLGGSGGIVMTYTNATDVQDLEGLSYSYGATIASLAGISVDYITFTPKSNPNKTCWGISVVVSLGGELEVHAAENYTNTTSSWNPLIALSELLYGGQ